MTQAAQYSQHPPVIRGSWLTATALFAVACTVFWRLMSGEYSASVDVAHHYSLVHWLTNYWTVQPNSSPILGEMTIYPRYSHVVAAIIGALVGSPFLGMQVVGAASIVLAFATLAMVPRLMNRDGSWILTILLTALLFVNFHTLRLDLFGHELAPNYFYSQMVGQAGFLVIVLTAIYFEQRLGEGTTVVCGILCSSVLLAGFHLLPAFEGVGYGLTLFLLYAVSSGKRLLVRLLVLAALTGTFGFALYLHPAFSAMRGISENNGFLPLNNIPNSKNLLFLTIASLVTSGTTIVLGRVLARSRHESREAVIYRHLGCAGISIAVLCLLQFVALRHGYGSEYSCRKYAFGLSTFLIINLALLLTQLVLRLLVPSVQPASQSRLTWLQPALLLLMFFFFTFARADRLAETASMLQLERTAVYIKQSGVLEEAKPSYARGLNLGVLSDVAGYLVSIGVFESRRDENGYAVLRNENFPHPRDVGYILTSTDNPSIWADAGCAKAYYPGGLALIRGQCVLEKFSDLCKHNIDFSDKGFLLDSALEGFSHPESAGRWTNARRARFSCKYPHDFGVPTKAILVVNPFSPRGNVQTLDITLNGVSVGRFQLTGAQTIELALPANAVANKEGLTFDFAIPDAVSPQELGLSPDQRKLGVWFQSLRFQ